MWAKEVHMALNETVARHLQQARHELVQQRDAMNRDIDQLDAMLQGYGSVPPRREPVETPSHQGSGGAKRDAPPTIGEAIASLLITHNRVMKTEEIVNRLHADHGWTGASIRSQISKMGNGGSIGRPRRGFYHHDPATTPLEDLEAPANTGASSSATTSGRGGDADGSPDHDCRDNPDQRNGDRDHRTSVVEEVH
jgi:hypothetical protein